MSAYDMDDYRWDPVADAVDGNTALAPAPAENTPPASGPTPAPASATSAGPGRFQVLDSKAEPAAPADGVARARAFVERNPRVVWLVLAGAALVTAAGYFLTREPDTMALARVKQRAAELDGETVAVSGRIGEVYQMGNSFAYLLLQGRDTVVVYTRTGHPIPGERVVVRGSVSTGYLDGAPRVAIFQSGTQ